MTTPALNQHLAAPLRQIPGQTVRVADGDHRQFGFLLCLKDPPVPGALSGLHSADTGHSGPERQNRPQVKASLNRRIIASNSISMDELMALNRPEPSPQPTAQESSSPITPIVIQCPLPEALTMLTQKTESIGWEVRGMREYLPNLRSHTDLTAVQNSMAKIQKSLTEMTTLLEQAGKKKEKHSCKWLDWLPDFDLIVVAKWIVLVLLIVAALLGMGYGTATVVSNIRNLFL